MVAVIMGVLRGPLASNARVTEQGLRAIGNLTHEYEHIRCDGE